jgi:hypothetical protein
MSRPSGQHQVQPLDFELPTFWCTLWFSGTYTVSVCKSVRLYTVTMRRLTLALHARTNPHVLANDRATWHSACLISLCRPVYHWVASFRSHCHFWLFATKTMSETGNLECMARDLHLVFGGDEPFASLSWRPKRSLTSAFTSSGFRSGGSGERTPFAVGERAHSRARARWRAVSIPSLRPSSYVSVCSREQRAA